MASSDDEAEILPERVSMYYFEDHDNEPVSFSVLPVRWSNGEGGKDAAADTIFLFGTADNGLWKIYREVKSWRFDLGSSRPQVSVLSKDNVCFKLEKPRRSFQDTIRTVLITLHCLHYARNHPNASGEALWEHLARTLGFCEVQPSAKDLQGHVALIKEAIGRDDALAKSKVLNKLMEEKPWERSKYGKNVAEPSFIVDDTEDVGMEDVEDGTAEEDDCFDSVCALCDNGGDLLWEIIFEGSDEDAITRAWDKLLPNRILIYCLKHDIDEEIETPVRNHIKFPTIGANRDAVELKRKKTSIGITLYWR